MSERHHVAVLALEAVVALDLAIPAQVFGTYPEMPYRVTVCAERPGPLWTAARFQIHAAAGLEALASADTVIVPGYYPHDPPSPAVIEALRASPARKVSICT